MHRMTCRTRHVHFRERRRPIHRMRYMRTVIWGVKILPVPALREDDVRSNAPSTRLDWEMIRVVLGIHARGIRTAAPVGLGVATIALLHVLAEAFRRASHRVAGEHAEAGSEGSGGVHVGGGVVERYPCVVAIVELVRDLRDAFVGAVAGFEVDVGGPVVTDVRQ